MKIRNEIRFLLNDKEIAVDDIACDLTLLDYLRLHRRLTGTKEGCAEGDCGACTVLVGKISNGKLKYTAVNACISFLVSLDGCHIVTIENLVDDDGALHPVQQAMVDCHGSQCGFCTPGIVMSLYGLFLTSDQPDMGEVERALQGNLCRCTGYQPIINAARKLSEAGGIQSDPLVANQRKTVRRLRALKDESRVEISKGGKKAYLPANLDDFATILQSNPTSTVVAGATDVGLWVTKHFADISPAVFIQNLEELNTITTDRDGITIGANVSYTDCWSVLSRNFKTLDDLWHRIGGEQVRNMGTVGGNIANGSPIGDTPPPLIALGAILQLRKGGRRRQVALEKFFIEYGKQDLRPGEFVESVFVPWLDPKDRFSVYKISKRRDEDITAVCSAFRVKLNAKGKIAEATVAFGGMAGTPLRAKHVEKALIGKPLEKETAETAATFFETDFKPLSDWRASAGYRMLVAKNLLVRFMLEQQGENIQLSRQINGRAKVRA